MGKRSEKISEIGNTFGNNVDYFLFSTRTKATIFTFARQLADYCGCHFHLMPLLKIPESKVCPMLPEFRMMYAQYAPPVTDSTLAQDPVDRINMVIFQNRAVRFDKTKSGLSKEDYIGAFPFIDDDCFCHAFSPEGVRIHKCAPTDFADYYLMVFAKKNKNADKLSEHISKFSGSAMRDLTSELYNDTPTDANRTNFFRAILANAENQIRQIMRNNEKHFIGKIPQSMLPPPALTQILNKMDISKSEITINNF